MNCRSLLSCTVLLALCCPVLAAEARDDEAVIASDFDRIQVTASRGARVIGDRDTRPGRTLSASSAVEW